MVVAIALSAVPFASAQEPGALENAMAGKYKGKVVTMAGPFTDNDAVKFDESVKDFEDKTGIDIQYTGSKEFEASIAIRVDGGNAPDIVDFPQPGLLDNFVKKGKVVDLSKFLDMDKLKANYNQSWLDMGTMAGPDGPIMAGIWGRVNGKSLVWYPKAEFDAAGYKIPTTWDELMALTDQIVADGDTPWCIGIESGAATGWAMTDWMEEIMLRTTSLENYDKWVKGELKFDSPEVEACGRGHVRPLVQGRLCLRRPPGHRHHLLRRCPQAHVRESAQVLAAQAGQLHHHLLPRGQGGRRGLRLLLPARPLTRSTASRCWWLATSMPCSTTAPKSRAVMQYFTTGASVEGLGEGRRRDLAAQGLQPGLVHQ